MAESHLHALADQTLPSLPVEFCIFLQVVLFSLQMIGQQLSMLQVLDFNGLARPPLSVEFCQD